MERLKQTYRQKYGHKEQWKEGHLDIKANVHKHMLDRQTDRLTKMQTDDC
jgi:hypothetical protein